MPGPSDSDPRRPVIALRLLDRRLRAWGAPHYGSDMAAGLDLHACIDAPLTLEPQAPAVLIPSGIAVEMPDAFMAGLVLARSGLGHGKGLVLGQGVGTIDADYRGEILISAWLRTPPGSPAVVIAPGDRIAQLVFVPILRPRFRIVEAFAVATVRDGGGFGSTGVGSD